MNRRKLLVGCSTVLTGILAGCGGDGDSGDGSDGSDGGSSDGSSDATPTPTEEPMEETATPTPTEEPMEETATPTPTESGMESENTHEIGEEFTVGEGDNAVTYKIIELKRSKRIGSNTNYDEAKGTYLVVILELTNDTGSTLTFPSDDFRVVDDSGNWKRLRGSPTEKITSDERVDVQPIGEDTFTSGSSKVGAVVFDVDPDTSYRLWITPTGSADEPEHFVPVGLPSEVEELRGSLTG